MCHSTKPGSKMNSSTLERNISTKKSICTTLCGSENSGTTVMPPMFSNI